MDTVKLTDDERRVVCGALYTAIEKYRQCIKELEECSLPNKEAWGRLIVQFERQIVDCRDILEKLEE